MLRPSVVIKTHAATGQRTASGNILNAVWDTTPIASPSHSPTHSVPEQHKHTSISETDSSRRPPPVSRESSEEEGDMDEGPFPMRLSLEQLQPAAIKGSFKKFGGSFMKAFSDG